MEAILMALLASAVTGNGISEEQKAAITTENIPSLFRLAKKHDLLHLVAAALERNGLALDEGLQERCFQYQTAALLRYEQSQYALEELSAFFVTNKIPYIPLKGAVIRCYYPEPWMRTSCDLDILVPENMVEQTAALMEKELGYRRRDKTYHDVSLMSPLGVHVELHFNIKENMDNIDSLLGRVWEFATPENEGTACRVLTPEYQLFHLLAHMSYHFVHGGCGVRTVLDWWVLNRSFDYDAVKLKEMCESAGIARFCEAVDALSHGWFDAKPLSDLCVQMQAFILYGGVYGNLENRIAVQRADKTERKGKGQYILARAWLPLSELRTSDPILEKYPVLQPFCQLARWVSAIKSGRIKKSVTEIKVNDTVSQERLTETSALLDALGL